MNWIFCKLKKLQKHEFHEEEGIGNGRRALQQLLENSDSDSESESWCITWIFSLPSFRTKIANFLIFRPRIYVRNDQCSLIFKRNPSNSACKIILVFFFVKNLDRKRCKRSWGSIFRRWDIPWRYGHEYQWFRSWWNVCTIGVPISRWQIHLCPYARAPFQEHEDLQNGDH